MGKIDARAPEVKYYIIRATILFNVSLIKRKQFGPAGRGRARETRGMHSRDTIAVLNQRGSAGFSHRGRHVASMEFSPENTAGCAESKVPERKVSKRVFFLIDDTNLFPPKKEM